LAKLLGITNRLIVLITCLYHMHVAFSIARFVCYVQPRWWL